MVRAPYGAVVRLFAYAERYWAAIDGEAASRGADYLALPVDRFLNAIYWWAVQRMKDVEAFDRELYKPLGGVVTDDDLAEDESSFVAFASAFGVKSPSPAADQVTA